MNQLRGIRGLRALVCALDGPSLTSERDALDLIGEALPAEVSLVVIPAPRLSDDIFDLSTRLAGAFIQKFVNYGFHLVILGHISARVAASPALRDFVYESNRGRHVWFVEDLADLETRLSQAN